MDDGQPKAPAPRLVGEDTPPAWALPLIEAVRYMREEIERADFPSWREAITAMQNHYQKYQQESSAAMYPELKNDIEMMKTQLQSLPTESFLCETLEEELKPVKADIDDVQKALDGIREQFKRTMAYTNEIYISHKRSANMMKMPSARNLQQVPAPDGTLPWNTRVQGPDGEEIVLTPLVSTGDVLALGASELGTYVQVYYPGREVPEDLKERKRLVLLAIGRSKESYEVV